MKRNELLPSWCLVWAWSSQYLYMWWVNSEMQLMSNGWLPVAFEAFTRRATTTTITPTEFKVLIFFICLHVKCLRASWFHNSLNLVYVWHRRSGWRTLASSSQSIIGQGRNTGAVLIGQHNPFGLAVVKSGEVVEPLLSGWFSSCVIATETFRSNSGKPEWKSNKTK